MIPPIPTPLPPPPTPAIIPSSSFTEVEFQPHNMNEKSKLGLTGFGFGSKKKIQKSDAISKAFGEEEEESLYVARKKLKLTPLDYTEEERTASSRAPAHVIPTKKEDLYGYPIEWDIFQTAKLGESELRPWISKEITEYFGQLETELVDFIMNMVNERESPQEIEKELEAVLGPEDASNMIIKMWKKIIQVTHQVTLDDT